MRDSAALDELRAELIASAEMLAEMFYGRSTSRARGVLRFGAKGSAKVTIAGPQRGAWVDFEAGGAGGMLDMIQHHRGSSLSEAIAWARTWIGNRGSAPPAQQRQRSDQAERDAREADEIAHRIGTARALWAGRKPLANTVAETYLARRGITAPATGWPASVAFHPGTNSLIVAATLPDGTVQAVQRVLLTKDARKIEGTPGQPAKRSNGVMQGAAVRLPGAPDGPLLLAEGPETALSAWIATGTETWVTLGSMAKAELPAGRPVIACRDDDKMNSPADHRIRKALREWLQAGIDVKAALPWPDRRHDGSDLNDVLRADGKIAVRARIERMLAPLQPPPRDRKPLKDAHAAIAAAVGGFFASAIRHDPDGSTAPPIQAARVSVGTGKSFAARQNVASLVAQLRAKGDDRTAAFLVPTHQLGAEAALEFEQTPAARAAKLKAAIWRGREALDPETNGERMCLDLESVKAAQEAGQNVQSACCVGKGDDGARVLCPFFWKCGYQRQRQQKADVWFGAHELLFHDKPTTIGNLAVVVVDEGMWQSGLEGATLMPAAEGLPPRPPIALPLDTLAGDATLAGQPLKSQDLRFLRGLVLDVLRDSEDGPVRRDTLLATGLTSHRAAEARALEWQRKIDPKMYPGMPAEARRVAVKAAAGNRTMRRFVMLWHAIEALLQPDGPEASGWLEIAMLEMPTGQVRGIDMKGRKSVRNGWNVPVLILDATLDLELLRPYWPLVQMVADVEAETPHQRIIQVLGRSEAKSRFVPKKGQQDGRHDHNSRDLVAKLATIGRTYAPAQTLAVVQKDIRAALPSFGLLPPSMALAHHNSIAGIDQWKRAAAIVCVGRTSPAPNTTARITEALTGRAVDRLEGWYPKVNAWREMADGTYLPAQVDRHPHSICEAIRWQVCEGELVQIIGRVRGCNRTEADPVDVWLLTDCVVPLPITATTASADLEPTPMERMIGSRGIAFQNATDAAAGFPELWHTREAAKSALARGRLGAKSGTYLYTGECTQPPQLDGGESLRPIEYQAAGAGKTRCIAIYDPSLVSDPVAVLTELLGPLAWNSCTDAPADQPPPSPMAGQTIVPPQNSPPERSTEIPAHDGDPGWSPDAESAGLSDWERTDRDRPSSVAALRPSALQRPAKPILAAASAVLFPACQLPTLRQHGGSWPDLR